MKNLTSLQTDFYQISMIAAYIFNDKANEKTGFEGFARHIKSTVNHNENFYIFDGADEVIEYIETVKREIKTNDFKETFLELVLPKVTADKAMVEKVLREKWNTLETEFEYSVVPNGTLVFPLVPVFQFSGPKWIGQLIETYVTNIYNGRTGLATTTYLVENDLTTNISPFDYGFLVDLMTGVPGALEHYAEILNATAKEFRASTNKILLEAAFRRAPSKATADLASKIAIKNGWNGTSNVSTVLDGTFPNNLTGGTMAHSWIMSFENEAEAFKAWDRIFPGTTMLIDTYDVENAAKMIDRMAALGEITLPKEVRIDSDPLDTYTMMVNNIFGGKVGIFVSGDMTVDKFESFEARNLPYTKAMAGTKYCYSSMIVEKLNAGFVYKIVQFENSKGEIIKSEKKANGKKNYAGLKYMKYNEETDTLEVIMDTPRFGYNRIDKVRPSTKVEFISG